MTTYTLRNYNSFTDTARGRLESVKTMDILAEVTPLTFSWRSMFAFGTNFTNIGTISNK
jgi:hypothetical protein